MQAIANGYEKIIHLPDFFRSIHYSSTLTCSLSMFNCCFDLMQIISWQIKIKNGIDLSFYFFVLSEIILVSRIR